MNSARDRLLREEQAQDLMGVSTRAAILSSMFSRLLDDDSGEDVIEYGLLAALVGVAAVLIWQQLVTTVGTTFVRTNNNVQTFSTCTPDPGGGGC